MQFKLNSQPKKFLKIESSHVEYDDAYQEVDKEEDVSTPQTITTTSLIIESIQGFDATGTFQSKEKLPSIEYGSGIFPIPILNTKTEPDFSARGTDMNYEESLLRSMMNPVLPTTEAQKSTSKKINLKPLQKQKSKPKVVVLGGDQEEDAIIIE